MLMGEQDRLSVCLQIEQRVLILFAVVIEDEQTKHARVAELATTAWNLISIILCKSFLFRSELQPRLNCFLVALWFI